jgi:hypothetical protein
MIRPSIILLFVLCQANSAEAQLSKVFRDLTLRNIPGKTLYALYDSLIFNSFTIENYGIRLSCDTPIHISVKSKIKLEIANVKFRSLTLSFDNETTSGEIELTSSQINDCNIYSCQGVNTKFVLTDFENKLLVSDASSVFISGCKIGKVEIQPFTSGTPSTVHIHDLLIKSDSYVQADTVIFDEFTQTNSSTLAINPIRGRGIIKFNSRPSFINFLKFDFQYFDLVLDSTIDREDFYQGLYDMQRQKYYAKGAEKAHIILQKIILRKGSWISRYITLPIKTVWDNFGYEKELIFRNTAVLFLIFLIINCVLFRRLYFDVYTLDSLKEYVARINPNLISKPRYWVKIFPYSMYFTLLIFFGLRMNLQTLRLEYKWWAFYLFLQYLIGLICLAYLVNFVVAT